MSPGDIDLRGVDIRDAAVGGRRAEEDQAQEENRSASISIDIRAVSHADPRRGPALDIDLPYCFRVAGR